MDFMETASQNTYIFDPESAVELARLINQERVVTEAMGGALSGVPEPASLNNILDLACGAGGWGLDVAFVLPEAEVEGVDVSRKMVDYANTRARTQLLSNVSFGVMDITRTFEVPDQSFDLVNARFLAAVLKREAWLPFLSECHRVLRPGGLLRLTEAADFGAHALDYSSKTEAWADTYHNIDIIGLQMQPVLLDLGLLSEGMFDFLHQQAIIDLQSDSFCGIAHLTTIVGQKPGVCIV